MGGPFGKIGGSGGLVEARAAYVTKREAANRCPLFAPRTGERLVLGGCEKLLEADLAVSVVVETIEGSPLPMPFHPRQPAAVVAAQLAEMLIEAPDSS